MTRRVHRGCSILAAVSVFLIFRLTGISTWHRSAKISSSFLPKARASLGDVEVVIELGRYLAGEAGIYVSRVLDKKISRGETFLIVDGGLHHHLAASGNFGQILRKNYPAVVGTAVVNESMPAATVVGPLCTPLDLLADSMPLGHAEVGDLIVLFQSGAYGLSASPTRFLSHPEPGELLA